MRPATAPERWQLIEELFHSSLEREPAERAGFLDDACGDDCDLKRQVETLVNSYQAADNFIDLPPLAGAISSIVAEAADTTAGRNDSYMELIGRRIAHYEIHSLLGAGGMGEVYLAHDLSLDRQIALKILPNQFTRDGEQVARFEREARATSALNHPNIITIHEVGREQETHYIATELVSGQTLRRKIANGRLSIKDAIAIAIQTADALSAAHQAGIVHRDIKPENIMLRPDGLVKVLDFGLAKPIVRRTLSTTRMSSDKASQTDPAVLMGTLAYLSPEQVLRQEVDHRTDLFSLGVVLYEMVTGARPFVGPSPMATCKAIVSEPPEAINPTHTVPATLERIIQHSLEKDRSTRYQTAEQLRADLQRFDRENPEFLIRRTVFSTAVKYVILAAALSLACFAYLVLRPEGIGPKSLSEGNYVKQTAAPGLELSPSLSPDGKRLVYASAETGNWDIYIQPVCDSDSSIFPDPVNLTADSPDDDLQPSFSPDGQQIAFRSGRDGGGIFVMSADGKALKKLSGLGYTPVWSHDGSEIVFAQANGQRASARTPPPSALYALNVHTGKRRTIIDGDAVQPSCSPNGFRIAYWGMRQGGQRDLWTVEATGGNPIEVTNDLSSDWNPVWSHDGQYLYFASDRDGKMNLWRIQIDERSGATTGKPEPVKLPGDYVQHFSLSSDGRLMSYVQQSTRKILCQVGLNLHTENAAKQAVPIYQGSSLFSNPSVSPDGEWLAFTNQGEKQEDLFIMRRDGKGLTRITNDVYRDRGPRWSPDGQKIAFFSDRSGEYEIWLINSDGSGLERLTHTLEKKMIFNPMWSPDSQKLLYRMSGGFAYIMSTGESSENHSVEQVRAFDHPTLKFGPWDWSPDGSTLAGVLESTESGSRGLVLYSLSTREFEKITEFGTAPLWLNDNRRLLFYDKGSIYVVDGRTKSEPHKIYSVGPGGLSGFTVSRDNRSMYVSVDLTESDIWLKRVD